MYQAWLDNSSLDRACIKLSSSLAKPKMSCQQLLQTELQEKFKNCNFGLNSALSLIQAWFKPCSSLVQACLELVLSLLSSSLAKPKMSSQQPVQTVIHKKFKYCNFGLNSALSLIQAWFKPCSSLVQAWLDLGSSSFRAH